MEKHQLRGLVGTPHFLEFSRPNILCAGQNLQCKSLQLLLLFCRGVGFALCSLTAKLLNHFGGIATKKQCQNTYNEGSTDTETCHLAAFSATVFIIVALSAS